MDVSSLVDIKKNKKIPAIAPGDTVRVSTKIVEGDKERIQVFQGVVIKIKRGGNGASFTVRHVAFGIGVERTFPMDSPMVEKVEIVRQGKVRRSRLYYLRELSGREARRKIKRVERKIIEQVGEELLAEQPEEEIEPLMDEAAVAAAAAKEETAVAEQEVAKAPEAVKEEKKESTAKKPPETVKEEKKEAAGEKPAAKAPEAVQEEKESAAEVEPAAPVMEQAEATEETAAEPAEPAEDQKKETTEP